MNTSVNKAISPYTYPHRSREAKATYLSGIGGYSSRDGRFPIEFNVSVSYADLDFDSIWKQILKEYHTEGADLEENRLFKQACAKVYEEVKAHLFEWALEDIRRDIDRRESDTYFMLWDGTPVDAELELHGRGGKHLVVHSFDGFRLEGYSEEALYEALTLQEDDYRNETVGQCKLKKGYEWSVSNKLLDRLYRYVRQCEIDFTSKNASNQLECAAAWHVYHRAEDEAEALRLIIAAKEVLQRDGKLLYDSLDMGDTELLEAWRNLCVAAGLSPSDIMY